MDFAIYEKFVKGYKADNYYIKIIYKFRKYIERSENY